MTILDTLKDSEYNDDQVMRIIDEFWNDAAENWYEKEKQEEEYTIQSYRKVLEATKSEDEVST
jgi:general stress protein 26|tara:strand:- start:2591 stop:2779 length:189 start_codon:yes stop_codon:yes gene_type:complete